DEADANRLLQSVRQEGTEPSGLGAADLIARTGVNVLAHFCYPSGLQEAARSTVQALSRVGIHTSCRDVPASIKDLPGHSAYLGLEVFDCTLLHLAPEPLVEVCYPLAGLARPKEIYRI